MYLRKTTNLRKLGYPRIPGYRRILVITSILFSLACLALVSVSQADGPAVVINELMWMGSSASSVDEWIELRNLTDQPVDLAGWQLTKKSSGAEVPMLTIPAGKIIPAGGFFLTSNYANSNANSILEIVPDLVMTDVTLSNSALQVKLYDASHVLVDTADDGVGNPLAGAFDSATKKYSSMERNIVPGDGTLGQNWHAANKGLGFKLNAVELGTPTAANSNALPIANAGPDQAGVVGQEINFDGSDSSDPEGQTLTYVWDFGDGAVGSDATPKHTYAAAGTFVVSLAVNDGTDSATDTVTVTISPVPAAPPPTPPSPTPPPPPAAAVPPIVTSCHGLKLSELYPNPPGVDSDEFIELVNTGDEEVMLGACTVVVNTKTYALTVGATVPIGGFIVIKKSAKHFTLSNTGATVKLLDSDGTELDRTLYVKAPEGKSWARFNDGWMWTSQPTPEKANVQSIDNTTTNNANKKATSKTETKATSKKAKAKKKEEPPAQTVSIAQIQELDSGDKVMVRGIVTADVGTLGATMTFIQDGDGGTAVTIPNGEPPITVGNEVEITGTVRLKQGRRYVAAQTHGVNVISATTDLTPENVATDDVSQEQADQLVHIKGIVALASGNRIEIDDGSGPVPIYLKSSTGMVRPKVKAGDTVDAVGIVNVSTSGVRVLPRSQEDLKVERVLGASTAAVPTTIVPPSSSNQSLWYWVMAGLGGLGAGVKPLWQAWKRSKLKVEG